MLEFVKRECIGQYVGAKRRKSRTFQCSVFAQELTLSILWVSEDNLKLEKTNQLNPYSADKMSSGKCIVCSNMQGTPKSFECGEILSECQTAWIRVRRDTELFRHTDGPTDRKIDYIVYIIYTLTLFDGV